MIEHKDLFENCKTIEFMNMNDIYRYLKGSDRLNDFTVSKESASSFNNYTSFNDAVGQLLTGYDDYTKKIIDGIKCASDEEVETFGVNFDVCGSLYDMGAVVEGVPECCISDFAPASKKCIRIVLSNAYSSGIEAKYILNRGIAITNLIFSLLSQGYVLDLKYCFYYQPNCCSTSSMFFMNIPTDNLCIATIAYLMTPQFFRMIGVAVSDVNLNKNVNGYAKSFKPRDVLKQLRNESVYFSDGYDDKYFSNAEMKVRYDTVEKANETVLNFFNEYKIKKEKNV